MSALWLHDYTFSHLEDSHQGIASQDERLHLWGVWQKVFSTFPSPPPPHSRNIHSVILSNAKKRYLGWDKRERERERERERKRERETKREWEIKRERERTIWNKMCRRAGHLRFIWKMVFNQGDLYKFASVNFWIKAKVIDLQPMSLKSCFQKDQWIIYQFVGSKLQSYSCSSLLWDALLWYGSSFVTV